MKKTRREIGDVEMPTNDHANPTASISSVPFEVSGSISIMSDLTDPTAIEQFHDAVESVAVPSVRYSDRNIDPSIFESLFGTRALPLAPAIPL